MEFSWVEFVKQDNERITEANHALAAEMAGGEMIIQAGNPAIRGATVDALIFIDRHD
jgi:hypothetical protein